MSINNQKKIYLIFFLVFHGVTDPYADNDVLDSDDDEVMEDQVVEDQAGDDVLDSDDDDVAEHGAGDDLLDSDDDVMEDGAGDDLLDSDDDVMEDEVGNHLLGDDIMEHQAGEHLLGSDDDVMEHQAGEHLLGRYHDIIEDEERDDDDPGDDGSNDEFEEMDDYSTILKHLTKEWLQIELDHRVSKAASAAFWDLGKQWFHRLFTIKKLQRIGRKTPGFTHMRKQLYQDYVPPIRMDIGFFGKGHRESYNRGGYADHTEETISTSPLSKDVGDSSRKGNTTD